MVRSGRDRDGGAAHRPGFATPAAAARPRVRWWWPGGAVTRAGVERELRSLRDAGFARAEIALLPMGLPATVDPDAVRTWGTPRFTESVETALLAAVACGMRLDLTISPGWPLASPAVAGDRIGLAQRKLVQGCRTVTPGEVVDAVPPPEGDPTADDRLVAVTAARLADPGRSPAGSILLDQASMLDLTGHVADGTVRWTAPATGSWLVFSFWSRPSGQRSLVDAGPADAPVIDHFSHPATTAAIAHLDRHDPAAPAGPVAAPGRRGHLRGLAGDRRRRRTLDRRVAGGVRPPPGLRPDALPAGAAHRGAVPLRLGHPAQGHQPGEPGRVRPPRRAGASDPARLLPDAQRAVRRPPRRAVDPLGQRPGAQLPPSRTGTPSTTSRWPVPSRCRRARTWSTGSPPVA